MRNRGLAVTAILSLITMSIQAIPASAAYQTVGRVVDWNGSSLTGSSSNWVDEVASKELVQTNTTYSSANGGYLTLSGSSFIKASSDLPSFTTTTMSVFLWIKPTSNAGVLVSLGRDVDPNDADSEFIFSLNSAGKLVLWDFNGSQGVSGASTGSVTLNQWNYVGFTKVLSGSNSNIAMYINGNSSGTFSGGSRAISLNSFTVGKDPRDNNAFYSGGIQRATVWNTALSSSEVSDNYATTNGFAIAPVISISNNNQSVNANASILTAVTTNTGGAVSTYSISPSLPSGLSLNSSGSISGAPVSKQSSTTYTITATNPAGNSTATFSLLVLVGATSAEFANISTANYRQVSSISAALPAVGKATFLQNGKRISGCIKVSTVSSNGITASCSWKPSIIGRLSLKVIFYPTSGSYNQFTSEEIKVWVFKRTGNR